MKTDNNTRIITSWASSGSYSKVVDNKLGDEEFNEEYYALPVPETMREAFRILDRLLSIEEIGRIVSHRKKEFCAVQHFGLGLLIRNSWYYLNDEKRGIFFNDAFSGKNDYAADKKGDNVSVMFCDPDCLSEEFLKRYYDHLKRKWKRIQQKLTQEKRH